MPPSHQHADKAAISPCRHLTMPPLVAPCAVANQRIYQVGTGSRGAGASAACSGDELPLVGEAEGWTDARASATWTDATPAAPPFSPVAAQDIEAHPPSHPRPRPRPPPCLRARLCLCPRRSTRQSPRAIVSASGSSRRTLPSPTSCATSPNARCGVQRAAAAAALPLGIHTGYSGYSHGYSGYSRGGRACARATRIRQPPDSAETCASTMLGVNCTRSRRVCVRARLCVCV